jgi:DNA polymerase III subunit epsilon
MAGQICFTGFSSSDKERLGQLATDRGLDVVKTITQSLSYLVAGPNAGPVKLKNAREKNVLIMNEEQYVKFLIDGEVPNIEYIKQTDTTKIENISTYSIGIFDLPIMDTPTAVIDFETTGLNAGIDRVVELSVIRREPDGRSEIVLDTLINPHRPMGATEIHGITDADVADAPAFEDIADSLVKAISGCVIAAYNVYFDMRFFEYEMTRAGRSLEPPHICLMYLRPMLGLGSRCSLGEACQSHNIPYSGSHIASDDAEAETQLMEFYLGVMQTKGIQSFRDLCHRGSYKFLQSFNKSILRWDLESDDRLPKRLCSRKCRSRDIGASAVAITPTATVQPHNGLAVYWDSLKAAVSDLQIEEAEVEHLRRIVQEYGLRQEQVRMIHARAFSCVIGQFISDQCLDDKESLKLKRLHQCLSKLGWAPGE